MMRWKWFFKSIREKSLVECSYSERNASKKEENEEMLWVSCEINLIMTLNKTIGINEKFINIEKH